MQTRIVRRTNSSLEPKRYAVIRRFRAAGIFFGIVSDNGRGGGDQVRRSNIG